MANAQKGEVSFEALQQSWTIKLGTNAMCEIEDRTGQSINKIGEKLNGDGFTMKLMRTVFVCGMLDHHDVITEKMVGDILDDIGFEKASDIMQRAFVIATPEQKGGPPKGNRKAARA